MPLSDPRRYNTGQPTHPLLNLADGAHDAELTSALRDLAQTRQDAEIGKILASAGSPAEYRRVWHALCSAIEKAPPDEAVAPRVFAIPWIIVSGGMASALISCVLPDVGTLASALEEHGVFGASRNLGLSNALAGIESLEALPPSAVLHGWDDARVRDVPPAPIAVVRGQEKVDARFLLGAAIAPVHAPDIVETGANIGAWGTPALRAMTAQLATENVRILPMPRAPAGLYTAAYAGRRAALETAFSLFVSNNVRRFRMSIGDPKVTLSAHTGGELRIVLWSDVDDSMVEGFQWPLHPADDLDEIERVMTSLLSECRLPEPLVYPGVLPDRTPTGALLLPT